MIAKTYFPRQEDFAQGGASFPFLFHVGEFGLAILLRQALHFKHIGILGELLGKVAVRNKLFLK